MSSAVDIQIVSANNLQKIENFFNDATYRESIEFSASFNTRLCLERRLRVPFYDPQTNVRQIHSNLFINKRQRMPGFRQGQIYTYPAQRWRKSRRQYLNKVYRLPDRPFQALRKEHELLLTPGNAAHVRTISPALAQTPGLDAEFNGSLMEDTSSLGAIGGDTSDSKDSQQQSTQQQQQQQLQQTPLAPPPQSFKEDISKDWFYDDMDMNDVDSLEDPKSPADDEYDYDPRYGNKKRRKRRPAKRATGEAAPRRRGGAGRSRANQLAAAAAVTAESPSNAMAAADAVDGAAPEPTTPASSHTGGSSRRRSGSGNPRGRRRNKAATAAAAVVNSEPLSFEMAAAAVGVVSDIAGGAAVEEHADLRNYRKYL